MAKLSGNWMAVHLEENDTIRRDIEQPIELIQLRPKQRKDDFEPYCESFRPLNEEERLTLARKFANWQNYFSGGLISYQALPGGFTICNILLDNKLYTGCSHCIKTDRWLPIRGKMQAFRRAIEQSEGVEIPQQAQEGGM